MVFLQELLNRKNQALLISWASLLSFVEAIINYDTVIFLPLLLLCKRKPQNEADVRIKSRSVHFKGCTVMLMSEKNDNDRHNGLNFRRFLAFSSTV